VIPRYANRSSTRRHHRALINDDEQGGHPESYKIDTRSRDAPD
jgi:hypothetical protein